MTDLPEETLRMLRELLAEGKSEDEIAFMLRLDVEVVRDESRRLNTTKEQPR
jgi:hypothetical protein